jgi:ABC-type transport system involved in cytochrome bd biosynthesis fused ATPase/permease subunit
MKKFLQIFMAALLLGLTWTSQAQTNPTAQSLPYSQNFATYTGATTTYLAGWQGWTITGSTSTSFPTAAPALNQTQAAGTNATTASGVFDMNGKLGVLCTASALRTACLAINTTSLVSINVSFLAEHLLM